MTDATRNEPRDSPGLWTLREQAAAIRERRISSRELLEEYLSRIDRINPAINAVVTLDAERARETAARADEATAGGAVDLSPLHGLPITVKDAIETEGIRSTGGARELVNHVPARDAPAVGRLRGAGAVVFGKTNAPRWSGDIQTFNDLFGTTNNPWDVARTPGGSSGGAAAAVSAGLSSCELGTDIGGSVRIPSNFCGVFGHKPSFEIIPQKGYLDRVGGGVIDADINVFGPIARSAADLAVLVDVMAGSSGEDTKAWRLELPGARHADLRDYRIGTWLDDPAGEVATDVGDVLANAAEALAKAGANVSDSHPAIRLTDAAALFSSLITAAISVSTTKEIGDAISGTHRAWLDHHQARTEMRAVWEAWFRDFDVLLCPVTPMAAFEHDQSGEIIDRTLTINGRPRPHIDTLVWTGLVGVAYLPSTVVPVGFTANGLPVGVQVVGPYLEDRTSLYVARELESVTGGFTPPPVA